jgi:hypothetical protein
VGWPVRRLEEARGCPTVIIRPGLLVRAVDVLKVIDERGPLGLDELVAAVAADGLLTALDAAVDHGFLRVVGFRHGEGCYQLTQRGRRALGASSQASGAA